LCGLGFLHGKIVYYYQRIVEISIQML